MKLLLCNKTAAGIYDDVGVKSPRL